MFQTIKTLFVFRGKCLRTGAGYKKLNTPAKYKLIEFGVRSRERAGYLTDGWEENVFVTGLLFSGEDAFVDFIGLSTVKIYWKSNL